MVVTRHGSVAADIRRERLNLAGRREAVTPTRRHRVCRRKWETASKIGLAIRVTENDQICLLYADVLSLAQDDVRARLELEAVAAVFVGSMFHFSSGILVCSVGAVNLECR